MAWKFLTAANSCTSHIVTEEVLAATADSMAADGCSLAASLIAEVIGCIALVVAITVAGRRAFAVVATVVAIERIGPDQTVYCEWEVARSSSTDTVTEVSTDHAIG